MIEIVFSPRSGWFARDTTATPQSYRATGVRRKDGWAKAAVLAAEMYGRDVSAVQVRTEAGHVSIGEYSKETENEKRTAGPTSRN